jgi:hypothetical protein
VGLFSQKHKKAFCPVPLLLLKKNAAALEKKRVFRGPADIWPPRMCAGREINISRKLFAPNSSSGLLLPFPRGCIVARSKNIKKNMLNVLSVNFCSSFFPEHAVFKKTVRI